jgi:hypothetical protein
MAGIEAFFEEQDPEVTDVETKEPASTPVEEKVEEKSAAVVPPADTPSIPPTEEPKEEEEKGEVDDTVPPIPPTPSTDGNQVQETLTLMRQLLQEQAQRIAELEGRSAGLTKTLTESGHIDESDITLPAVEGAVSQERVAALDVLRETMTMNPSYADLNDVCSEEHYNQTVEALAKISVGEEGGTLTEQIQNVSRYIWALPNPYKFVYDIVKQNHPKYAKPPEAKSPGVRTPPTPPVTIATIPGGSPPPASGWTAAKIDALPEDELHSVPEAVYEKYMRNELP